MAGFFASYLPELTKYSSYLVQHDPADLTVASVHLALLQLGSYINADNRSVIKTQNLQTKQHPDFIDLLQSTIKMEHAFGRFILGMIQIENLGIRSKDPLAGYALVAIAAMQGCDWALHTMGNFYLRGNIFVAQNLVKAENNFRSALEIARNALEADPNNSLLLEQYIRALRNLGLCCFYQAKNHQALHYLLLAHQQGDPLQTLAKVYQIFANKLIVPAVTTTSHTNANINDKRNILATANNIASDRSSALPRIKIT